jgi:purine-binding chemotaxis protein CheW
VSADGSARAAAPGAGTDHAVDADVGAGAGADVDADLDADLDDERQSVVLFELGPETYAVRVEQVRRVVPPAEPVRLPGAPAQVLGVITLRGAVVAVIDPKVVLGLPPVDVGRRTRVLVTDVGASPTGLLVDSVRDVVDVTPDAFQPVPDDPPGAPGVAGVVRVGERTIVLLDAAALVAS